jgi:hypothetical protein
VEIADPDNDSADTHEVSALVGPEIAGWALHMNQTAFGNDSGGIAGFGSMAESVEPVRNVFLRDIGCIVSVRHERNFSKSEKQNLTTDEHGLRGSESRSTGN